MADKAQLEVKQAVQEVADSTPSHENIRCPASVPEVVLYTFETFEMRCHFTRELCPMIHDTILRKRREWGLCAGVMARS